MAATWIELHPSGVAPSTNNQEYGFYDAANNRFIAYYSGNPVQELWILTEANGLGATPAWIQLLPTGTPPAINGESSVIYDEANNQLVVYGGCFAFCSPAVSEVFALSHANGLGGTPEWTLLSVTNPQARAYHSGVYDPLNNLLIAFGGHFAFWGTDQNDTRVLSNANGLDSPSTWTTLSTGSAPPIRNHQKAMYDAANNRMMIFGGSNSIQNCCPTVHTSYNDSWVLANANGEADVPAWTQLTPTGTLPVGRDYHSAVYDPLFNRMIVFGGWKRNQATQRDSVLGDLWQLTNANGLAATSPRWTKLGQAGDVPGPRYNHAAAFDVKNQRMIIMGGANASGTVSNRVWVRAFQTCNGKAATIVGTQSNDVLLGTAQDDVIVGLGGNDSIAGAGGNDTICGGFGNDTVYGGDGDDTLLGDGGTDTANGNAGSDTRTAEANLNCEL